MRQEPTMPDCPPAPFRMNQIPPLRSSCWAVGRAWPTDAGVSTAHNAQQSQQGPLP